MAENPETKVTRRIRALLEGHGAHFDKLSDSFTRGIPDSLVATDGIYLIEFKVDRSKGTLKTRSYKSLGLSGAQDHKIRAVYRRTKAALIVTDLEDGGRLRVWAPTNPFKEGPGHEEYFMICEGEQNLLRLIGLGPFVV